jgi:uncharacterized phage-like protein YoqJ
MKIAITGHRPNKLGNDYDLKSELVEAIKHNILKILKDRGIIYYDIPCSHVGHTLITGMALGIDTLFAKIAIEYKIPFIAAIPFKGQESMWPIKSAVLYHILLTKAKEIVIVSEGGYSVTKMQLRNEWMVDNCDLLIAIWDGSAGGTANCIKYAKDKKEIIYINPLNL